MDFEEIYDSAENYYIKRQFEKALELFQKANEINENADCLNYIGACYLSLVDFENAITVFKKLSSMEPDWERPVMNLGRTYMKKGEDELALEYLNKAIALNPCNEDIYYYLGIFYQNKNDYPLAIGFYQKSLNLDMEQSETHQNLGLCYMKQGNYDLALNEFDKAISYDKDNSNALYNQGVTYRLMKDYNKALKVYLKMHDLEPDNVEHLKDLSSTYFAMKDFVKSKYWNDEVLKIDPDDEVALRVDKKHFSGKIKKLNIISYLEETESLSNDNWSNIKDFAEDDNSEVRFRISELLALFPSDESENLLLSMLNDNNHFVRASACDSLSFSKSPETLRMLMKAVKDKRFLVRGYAALSIGEVQKNIGFNQNETVDYLKNLNQKESSEWVKVAISYSLYILGEYAYGDFILEKINSRYYKNRCLVLSVLEELMINNMVDKMPNILPILKQRLEVERAYSVTDKLTKLINKFTVSNNLPN